MEYKLKYLFDIKSQCNGLHDEQICEYFNYWLANEINKINPNSNNISGIAQACNIGYTAFVKRNCSYKVDQFKNNDFPKMKEFFDYTENLKAIDEKVQEFTLLTGVFYCAYINKAVNKYNEVIKNGSCHNSDCTYYNELRRFKEQFNSHYESLNKKCSGKINCIRKEKEEFESLCAPLPDNSSQHSQTYSQLSETPGNNSMSIQNVIITIVCTILLIGFFFLFLYKVKEEIIFTYEYYIYYQIMNLHKKTTKIIKLFFLMYTFIINISFHRLDPGCVLKSVGRKEC